MLAFAIACFFMVATPGPGVLSVAGVGAGYGLKEGSRYLWGLCAGNAFVGLAVATGVAAAVFSLPYLREVLLGLSVCYMLYLAGKIAFAGSKVGFIEANRAPRFRDGFLLQTVNPKAYVANTVLFSGFSFLQGNVVLETVLKFPIWIGVWIPVHFAWLMLGVVVHRMELPDRIQRIINVFMALSMLLVVALAVRAGV